MPRPPRRPPGRPPKPTELRVVQGNPGKRPIPSSPPPSLPPGVPEPPGALGDAGRAAWSLYWEHGGVWLAFTDLPLVARLCRLIDRMAEMEAAIDDEGLLHENPETGRSSPHYLLNGLLGVYKHVADMESRLGFTPTDRSRLNMKPRESDPLGDWEARKA